MKYQNVFIFHAVDDDVLARRKTPQPRTQILIAATADVRVTGKKEKPLGEGINNAVGNLDAATFLGYVMPNSVKLSFGPQRDTMRH